MKLGEGYVFELRDDRRDRDMCDGYIQDDGEKITSGKGAGGCSVRLRGRFACPAGVLERCSRWQLVCILLKRWSGRRGSNPRRPAWEDDTRLETKNIAFPAPLSGD